MCYKGVSINAVSSAAPRGMFVPCGYCEECRNTSRNAWAFRLCAEIEHVKLLGWKVGFLTLTYNDEHMPTIPKSLFKDEFSAPSIPCFSRGTVTDYIKAIRKKLHRDYLVTDIKYMVCSEYGKNPRKPENPLRPHYHMVIAWNPLCQKKIKGSRERVRYTLGGDEMHELVTSLWTRNGFCFPKDPHGGFDKEGYYHKPFVVDNAGTAAARYAGKYCCKDVHFHEMLKTFPDLVDDEVVQKFVKHQYFPFHVQSQSLGFSAIKDMTNDQKYDLIIHGMQFIGETERVPVPLYIKHKLFFTPVYSVDENGKRLVRKHSTEFFDMHRREIFERKVSYYQDLVNRACSTDFWLSSLRDNDSVYACELALSVSRKVQSLRSSSVNIAADYLAFYGVARDECLDVDRCDQWYRRYSEVYECLDDDGNVVRSPRPIRNLMDDVLDHDVIISDELYWNVQNFWNDFFRLLSYTNGTKKFDFDVDEVKSFFKEYKDVV